MPEKKGRTCYVPLCKGGYKSFKEKVSLFRAPADPVRRQEWARNIKRGDKVLDETCVVCSRHFDDRYIQRTFKHVINGEDVEFDRERPSLTPDAVPTIFPDGPAYLTKPVPRKRKERNIADCTAPPAKRKAPNEPTTSQARDDAAAGEETAQAPHPFHSITPPSAFCSHVDVVREAWIKDSKSLTLKVMPHITESHVQPKAFEKMRVNLAFQLFSKEVLKGIFLFKDHLVKTFKITQSTEKFIQTMERLIFIMTARIPSKGLRCGSASAKFLEDFLPFLREWEEHAAKHGEGFLSESTALGLLVTIQSTLSLLSYVTSTLKYTYLLTANLSQDKKENVFGVVRQAFGSNGHPSPEQFSVVINNMAFYSLARPPKGGNSPPELVTALFRAF
ncbi:hypothetical protein HPB51_012926 [Rhipicephalus microplus]|uniref:THAP-type domain-containing protein n=1 Tax=Rhipicephalus microplus TaxID=6941 RepID=A0A9J6F2N7_RHIMP|nr:hypothetical protein HPB51_012926 [Rhipicephalus microplus]